MAVVNILAAFGYKWAETGTVEALDDAQYKAGWAFIGSTPPSVEQFNKVHQIADEKANYLYGQMNAVFTAGGQVPAAGTSTTLRDAINSLIQTAGGRLMGVRAFTTTGASTYTPTAGTRFVRVRCQGGGGAGGGVVSTSSGAFGAIGVGGGGGGYSEGIFFSSFSGVTVTVGAGGTPAAGGAGGSGGASSFGALLTGPGGTGGPVGANLPVTTALYVGGAANSSIGTGGYLQAEGGGGGFAQALAQDTFASGQGGAGMFGAGGQSRVTSNLGGARGVAGSAAGNYGAGGSGAGAISASPGTFAGGAGGRGAVFIEEYA